MSELSVRIRAPLARFELDLELASRSRALGFFGPSGAGKSTVLEVLAGWRRVELAKVTLDGRTLVDSERRAWLPPDQRGIGYVPEDVLLFEHWNVWRNVTAGAQRGGPSDQRLVAQVLDVLELNDERRRAVGELAPLERLRVALARALCSRPALLLLDEPLGALDRPLRRQSLSTLIRVREEFGVPLVCASRDATELAALCDEVVILSEGRAAALGPPAEVFTSALGARAVGSDLENVLSAPVVALAEGTATLDLAGLSIVVPRAGLALGERAVVAVRSDDVLIATERPAGLSARNVLPARVLDWIDDVGDVILRLALGDERAAEGAPRLSVQITAAALRELGLEPGKRVFAIFKTRATRVLSALEARDGRA